MTSRHVLVVAWGFPPSRASGVHRPVAMARELRALGHRVTVIACDEDFFRLHTGTDETLMSAIPDIRLVRVPHAAILDPVINQWDALQISKPKAATAAVRSLAIAQFPEAPPYGGWAERASAAALRVHRADPIDLVIATGNPYADYVVADVLNMVHGVPMVIDDRDSLLYHPYTGEVRPQAVRAQHWVESMIARATEMWFVNPSIVNLYRKHMPHYSEKIVVVENGWDPHVLRPTDIPGRSDECHFGQIGVINASYPLEDVLSGWVAARGTVIPADATLHLYGSLGYRASTDQQRRLLKKHADDGVIYHGLQPRGKITEAYAGLSGLVFTREGQSLFTSSRLYEYVASGLPIAAVTVDDMDANRIIDAYPRAHRATQGSADAWITTFGAAWRDAQAGTPERIAEAQAFALAFRRDNVLRPALERVLQACG